MKYGKALRVLGQSLLIMAFLVGAALISIGFIKKMARQMVIDRAKNAAESAINNGEGDVTYNVPDSDFYAIDGELGEEDVSPDRLIDEMTSLSSNHKSLKLIGLIEIPCIKVKEPIWDSCSKTALRFGVGRFPETCKIGEPGNCTIFGHRMRQSKTIFWQLQKLSKKIGEEVIVTTTDGVKHRYRIVDTVYVKDSAVDPYLTPDLFTSEHLCIATCGSGKDPYNKKITRPRHTEFIVICVPSSD